MVSKFPYRFLSSSASYDVRISNTAPVSVPSRSSASKLPATAPPRAAEEEGIENSIFKKISPIEGHDSFFQKLINAKCIADMSNSTIEIQWRGYKTKVAPKHPPFTKETFMDRLLLALAGIDSLSDEENKVLFLSFRHN